MKKEGNNFAFIDCQNVYQGVKQLGWHLDWRRFRRYLAEKHRVSTAYIFLGYIPANYKLYGALQRDGYYLEFRKVALTNEGVYKGNVDVNLTMKALLEVDNYGQAVIATSDGDFYPLVDHLRSLGKLKVVLSPNIKKCSALLKQAARDKIEYVDNLRDKLGYV